MAVSRCLPRLHPIHLYWFRTRMTDVLFAVVSDLIDLDQIDDENILQTKLPMRHLTRGLKTLRRARLG